MAHSRKWRRYRGWLAAVTLMAVAVVVLLMLNSAKADDESTTTYTSQPAETGTLSVTVSGTGNLQLADTSEVWPSVAGTVDSVKVAEGDKVRKGEVLFTLDAGDAEANTRKALVSYRQSQSSVLQSESQVIKAERALDALEDKSDAPSTTVTEDEIRAAEADLDAAKASLEAAKAQRSSARDGYREAQAAEADLLVTAPVSGIVHTINVDEGDAVGSSSGSSSTSNASSSSASSSSTSGSTGGTSAAVVIVPKKPLVATLSVNEVDLPALEIGQRADVEFDALPDVTVTGKVTEISDEGTVSQGVVTFDVTVALDVRNPNLKPGMTATATIVTAVRRGVLLVPNAAVKSDDDGSYVRVLDAEGGEPRRVAVEIGLAGATQTEIVSGVSAGDSVVTAESSAEDGAAQGSTAPGGGTGAGGMMMRFGGPGR